MIYFQNSSVEWHLHQLINSLHQLLYACGIFVENMNMKSSKFTYLISCFLLNFSSFACSVGGLFLNPQPIYKSLFFLLFRINFGKCMFQVHHKLFITKKIQSYRLDFTEGYKYRNYTFYMNCFVDFTVLLALQIR